MREVLLSLNQIQEILSSAITEAENFAIFFLTHLDSVIYQSHSVQSAPNIKFDQYLWAKFYVFIVKVNLFFIEMQCLY